jgi:hypothetical protein
MKKIIKSLRYISVIAIFTFFLSLNITYAIVIEPGETIVKDPETATSPNPASQTKTKDAETAVDKTTFTLANPLKTNTVSELVQEIIKIASYVGIILAVLALVYVGFMFVMARGDTKKIQEYKDWLLYIVIGVAIIIGARLIVSVVINTLEATGVVDTQVIQSAHSAVTGN